MAQTILIVDDDPTQRRLMEAVVAKGGHKVVHAGGGKEALSALDANPNIALMLLDLVMPGMDGYEVLEESRKVKPELPVIVLTAQGGIDTVVKAMRAGANDFAVKPASPERLLVSIENVIKVGALSGEVKRLKRKASNRLTFDDLIAKAPAHATGHSAWPPRRSIEHPDSRRWRNRASVKSSSRVPFRASQNAPASPFVAVNCGALPENLVESILFGHKKGAFTGANEEHAGKFQEANGGTLFLDEIGELRPDIQVKLLRALQEGEVDPIGSNKPVKVDIRLISATNRNLLKMAETGDFREDLYYRLNVFPVNIPPLRERREDVPALIDFFIQRFAAEEGKRILGVDPGSMSSLVAYNWPGNVRQLENTVFRAVVLAEGEWLTMQDFPQVAASMDIEIPAEDFPIAGPITTQTAPALQPSGGIAPVASHIPRPEDVARPIEIASETSTPIAVPPQDGFTILDDLGHLRPLEAIEGDMIKLAIERYDGHMSEVARRLGIGRSTLYRKVRDLGLDVRAEE